MLRAVIDCCLPHLLRHADCPAAKSRSKKSRLAVCKGTRRQARPVYSACTLTAASLHHSRHGGRPLEISDATKSALIIDDCGAFASPHTPQARVIRERGRPPRRRLSRRDAYRSLCRRGKAFGFKAWCLNLLTASRGRKGARFLAGRRNRDLGRRGASLHLRTLILLDPDGRTRCAP